MGEKLGRTDFLLRAGFCVLPYRSFFLGSEAANRAEFGGRGKYVSPSFIFSQTSQGVRVSDARVLADTFLRAQSRGRDRRYPLPPVSKLGFDLNFLN